MKGLKLFLESFNEEMGFIKKFFQDGLEKTSALVYADWLQENDQEALAIEIRNAITGKSGSFELINRESLKIQTSHNITLLDPPDDIIHNPEMNGWFGFNHDSFFMLDGPSQNQAINKSQTIYTFNNFGKWYTFHNDSNFIIYMNDLSSDNFRKADNIPDHIIKLGFFELLSVWSARNHG